MNSFAQLLRQLKDYMEDNRENFKNVLDNQEQIVEQHIFEIKNK
jgi:hypothetical protein